MIDNQIITATVQLALQQPSLWADSGASTAILLLAGPVLIFGFVGWMIRIARQ